MEVGTAVDLGLTVNWADMNLGAEMPADVGFYYAFGEVEPKESYDEESQKFKDSDAQITDYYKVGTSDIAGNASYDAAAKNWGKNWRMPTPEEVEELLKKCTWKFSSQKNSKGESVGGYAVTCNAKTIFMPAGGYVEGKDTLSKDGGTYWVSQTAQNSAQVGKILDFAESYGADLSFYDWKYGALIRPVQTNENYKMTPKNYGKLIVDGVMYQNTGLVKVVETTAFVKPNSEASDIFKYHNTKLKPYAIGKYEVTQEFYTAVMGTNPSYFVGEEAAKKVADGESQNLRPVESVKWFNAIVFCNELTKKNFGCR